LHGYRESVVDSTEVRMIVSFGDQVTEELYHGIVGRNTRKLPPDILRIALRKLDMLNAADSLRNLGSPPGNRLEALVGDLAGFHSIRINQRWRIVFRWTGSDAERVRITDYH
jgi:toxin HigB-1